MVTGKLSNRILHGSSKSQNTINTYTMIFMESQNLYHLCYFAL